VPQPAAPGGHERRAIDRANSAGDRVLLSTIATSWGQTTSTMAYTTSHAGKNLPWLGLATQGGRYEVLLADGCDGIAADMNVQADQVCSVTPLSPRTLRVPSL
jgi:hypothetical protein